MAPPVVVLAPATSRHWPLCAACKALSDDGVKRPEENVQRKLDAMEQACWVIGAESLRLAELTLAQSPLRLDTIWKLPPLAANVQSSAEVPEHGCCTS